MTKRTDNTQAIDAFIARKAEFDAMLARLQNLSADHFNWAPDEINWGHAGTMAHYAEMLKRITDSAFHEGEFAA
ncbi:hypothetical protein [Magnetospirillum sp. SS-4]|uniref:hypothetical protein n=1 Tax=Magnetospirillum sp. SS-4 TaxID=2681465 RepID=UPI0013831618|nr:hypothetical protein [Magnetospirillum sp. SS-4]MBF0327261.1 hypothetical protein [Alphaproteobacteria bacterium]CAA7614826.1 conserved hypothetical protein [Magnetospirillum sp. SS-4]